MKRQQYEKPCGFDAETSHRTEIDIRNRLIWLCFIAALCCAVPSSNAAEPATEANDAPSEDRWEYSRKVIAEKSRSERVEGILLRNGEPVPGRWGQILDTPKGRFMYFTNPAQPAYLKGWLNKLTYEKPVFEEDGTLTEIFWKMTESMPLTLHQPTGEAPTLLREIDSWEHKSMLHFEAGDRFEYLSFKDESATKWSKKVYDLWAQQRKFNKKRDVRYPPQTYVFQAWATVLNIGDWYVTYQLDTQNKALILPAMVSVGENKWYYVDGSPFTLEEILFEFDADPISVKEGKVTITRPRNKVKPKVTVPFRIIHSPRVPGRDYETWGISIEEPHCQYYMRYQRFDTGLTCFVPSGRPQIFRPDSVQPVLDIPARAEPATTSAAPAPAGRDDEKLALSISRPPKPSSWSKFRFTIRNTSTQVAPVIHPFWNTTVLTIVNPDGTKQRFTEGTYDSNGTPYAPGESKHWDIELQKLDIDFSQQGKYVIYFSVDETKSNQLSIVR